MFDAPLTSSPIRPTPPRTSAWAGLGLHQLRYVLAAAEHGGFRRAARSLGVQQSAVSRRIHDLEARLGARIFDRAPCGVRLTAAGADFVAEAKAALASLDRAVDRAAELGQAEMGVLRVGMLGGLGPGPLDDLMRRLLEREPDLQVDLLEADGERLASALLQDHLDIAFMIDPPARLDRRLGWRERLVVALPTGHPLAAKSALAWEDLAGRRLLSPTAIALAVSRLARRRDPSDLNLQAQAASAAGVARLVALGQGFALINETAAPRVNGVVFRPLTRAFLTFRAIVGRRADKPALRRLLDLLPDET